MTDIAFYFSLVSAMAATVFFFIYAYRQKPVLFNIGTIVLFISTLSLATMLFVIGVLKNQHPITSTFESFNFLALLVLIIYFIAEYKFKIRFLCTFLPPIALFLMVLAMVVPNSDYPLGEVFSVALLSTHVTFALLGEVAFLLSAAAAVMYLIQEHNLKKKRFKGTFFRLPSLNRLERTASVSLLFGFPFLTAGLALGFIQAAKTLGGEWWMDAKIVFTMITWIVYSVLFMLRIWKRIQGRKFIIWIVISFILVILCYGIANYFSGFHFFIFKGSA